MDALPDQVLLPPVRRPATIRDVARAAQVSIGTASKALNGRGQLRGETRLRVRDAAERLGFRPNELVRSLLRGRTFTVGLLTTDSYGRFSIPLLTGIEDALGAASASSVFLCNAPGRSGAGTPVHRFAAGEAGRWDHRHGAPHRPTPADRYGGPAGCRSSTPLPRPTGAMRSACCRTTPRAHVRHASS